MFEGAGQVSLFGDGAVTFDPKFTSLRRIDLDTEAWIDYAPMWLGGDEALFRTLVDRVEWSQPVTRMYDRDVTTPRLVGTVDEHAHPAIPSVVAALSERYAVRLDRVSAGWYRDGADSVAYHGDRIARDRDRAIVATISLGAPRRFLIRPKGGGHSTSLSLGHGDLVVMGGSCQRTWEHSVPKVKNAEPRIALMFRHAYD